MRHVLDNERLDGPQTARVALRPTRTARLIPPNDMAHLLAAIELSCQIWGGGAHPVVPLDNDLRVHHLYRNKLRGAHID
jgi:hypothetical protein